jgi:2-keto-4-pentenoate hydratase/2-oxohepta-3-ene-1,7-dioic acid hydratase in catechol pathway
MRLCSILDPTAGGGAAATIPAVVGPDGRLAPLPALAPDLPADLMALLEHLGGGPGGLEDRLAAALAELDETSLLDPAAVTVVAPYRRPRKILGIGLNYRAHADDLAAESPTEPASFLKGDHTIIGPGEPIVLPPQSRRVTAEAELGLVIGRECRDVEEEDALDHVAAVCTVLDQTAEDILQRNPRFLTRSKNFPTFFSFGPQLVTLDEVLDRLGAIEALTVATHHNGQLHRADVVASMAFLPAFLVSFHSKVMPLHPGDIISTGTPGAVVVEDGDEAACVIDGIGTLRNPVVRPRPPGPR